jgi:Na+/glutamate symporter
MQNVNLSVLFLAKLHIGAAIGIAVGTAVLGLVIGALIYKIVTDKKVGSAKQRVEKIVSDAENEAELIRANGREESKRGRS